MPLILAGMGRGRREQVLGVLRLRGVPLDDDEVADLTGINRVYVNVLCWSLAEDGLVARHRGPGGKLVSVAAADGTASAAAPWPGRAADSRGRVRSSDGQADRIEALVAGFSGWVSAFDAAEAFPGPSLYFHERAITRRREARDGRVAPGRRRVPGICLRGAPGMGHGTGLAR